MSPRWGGCHLLRNQSWSKCGEPCLLVSGNLCTHCVGKALYAGQTERFSWPSLKLVGERGSAARDFAEGSRFAHAFLAPQFEPPTPQDTRSVPLEKSPEPA